MESSSHHCFWVLLITKGLSSATQSLLIMIVSLKAWHSVINKTMVIPKKNLNCPYFVIIIKLNFVFIPLKVVDTPWCMFGYSLAVVHRPYVLLKQPEFNKFELGGWTSCHQFNYFSVVLMWSLHLYDREKS